LLNVLVNSYVFWILLISGLLTLYILPSLIGAIRGVEGLGWIVVINLLSGGVGWLAALLLAVTQPRRYPQAPPMGAPMEEPGQQRPPSSPPAGPPVPAGATVISGDRYHVIQSTSVQRAIH
jgi:hypothetical protein